MSEPALIGFPSNPSVDDEYDGWVWDGAKWVQIEMPAFEIDDDHLLKKAEDNIVPAEFAIHVAGGAMFKSNSMGWDDVTEVRYTGIETTGAVIAGSFVGDGSALTNLPIQIPDSYTKAESDAKYQLQGDYALNGASYTKVESDGKYQLIGDYSLNGVSYTKAESDANYAVIGASYTKVESDAAYQPAGNYAPDGNYALVGASYTKAESDSKWQPKEAINRLATMRWSARRIRKPNQMPLIRQREVTPHRITITAACISQRVIMRSATTPTTMRRSALHTPRQRATASTS